MRWFTKYTHTKISQSYNSTGEEKVAHDIPYTYKWHTTQFLQKSEKTEKLLN